jgi:hypothetical protein
MNDGMTSNPDTGVEANARLTEVFGSAIELWLFGLRFGYEQSHGKAGWPGGAIARLAAVVANNPPSADDSVL